MPMQYEDEWGAPDNRRPNTNTIPRHQPEVTPYSRHEGATTQGTPRNQPSGNQPSRNQRPAGNPYARAGQRPAHMRPVQFTSVQTNVAAPTMPQVPAGTEAINPQADLRNAYIKPGFQAQHDSSAAWNVEHGTHLAGPRAIAGTNLGGARASLQGAEGEIDQAKMGTYGAEAGTDLTGARNRLGEAKLQVDGAQMNRYGGVEGPQYAAVRAALAAAGRDVDGAQLGHVPGAAMTNTSGARGLYDEATGVMRGSALREGFNGIGAGSYGPSGAANEARDMTMQALRQAMGGPDRGELAAQKLQLLEERSQPGFQTAIRNVGKKSAAWGRMGSGLVNKDLGEVVDAREVRLDQARRELATEAAGMEMQDRTGRANLGLSAGGQLRGEDLNDAGMQQSLRNEARGERSARLDQDARRAAVEQNRAQGMASMGDRNLNVAGVERGDRVGERDFAARRDSERANLSLQRGNARQSMAGQEAGLAESEYGARANERNFQSNQDRAIYDAALRKAGVLQGMAGQEADFAGIERGDRVEERDFRRGTDAMNADLALRRSAGKQSVAGQKADFAGIERRDAESDRAIEYQNSRDRSQLGFDKARALTELDNTRFGRESSLRGEQRQERGYQADSAQQALQNRVNSVMMGDQLQNSAHARNMDRLNAMIRAAFSGGDGYAGALLDASGQNQGGSGGADLLQRWMMQQARNGGGNAGSHGRPAADTSDIYGGYA